ncbi:MAG: Lrp/AsnC family transcriptional regulator [Candidatus Zixiibacteriota bacterium]|nr:MAG: Lrp/AsnC family transcriptional regulator [candidate division Zixibacteria bacterium]
MIDDVDRKILSILQKNARDSNANIARELGLAPSAIHERVKKLEQKGIIKGYHARLDAPKLGFCVTAFVFVRSDDRVGSVASAKRLGEIDEVEEVHHIAGEDCYLVKLRVGGNEELGRLLREKIGAIHSIKSTRTSVVLETLKEGANLPVTETR